MKREELTYGLLKKKGVWMELDSNGQPIIYQKKWWTNRKTQGKKWMEERPQFITNTNPQYKIVPLKLDDSYRTVNQTVQDIVFILSHPKTHLGTYDVDHIDNNSLNNNPENLMKMTRKENIRKREHCGANQYRNKSNWNDKKWVK